MRDGRHESLAGYRLTGELGRGATSVVYRAERAGTVYALKLLRESVASQEPSRRQFRREAAAVAQLRHGNLVPVVELGEEHGAPYLVMGLAPGRTLAQSLQAGPLEPSTVVDVAIQIADALDEVHRFGLVHRDVKPDNIIIDEEGCARLVDFGLVAVDAEPRSDVGGTIRYAPPEQLGILPRAPGPASDLYALGVTMFEGLTGSVPFVADRHHELLHQLATLSPPRLDDLRPGCSPTLTRIVDRLLQKDPDDRYQSAAGLREDLRSLERLDAADADGRREGLRTSPGLGAEVVALVGRADELRQLRAAWRWAREGRCVFQGVRGAAGTGKSRLVDAFTGELREALVLRAKCQEHDRSPFAPIRALFAGLAGSVGPEDIERLNQVVGGDTPILAQVSPALGTLLDVSPDLRTMDPSAAQQRFYRTIATALVTVATEARPLVVVVDDIQWLDEASQQVFDYISRNDTASNLLVVSTARSEPCEATRRFREGVSERSRDDVVVRPLGAEALAELVTQRLGGRPLSTELMARIRSATGSNPFVVLEYLRVLLQSGELQLTDRGWSVPPETLDALALPEDVFELVMQRLVGLDSAGMTVLRYVAVVGATAPLRLLQVLTSLEPGAFADAVRATVDAGVLARGSDGSLTVQHDRIREAVLADLSAAALADAHQRVADALDPTDRSPGAMYAMARHLGAGRVDQAPERAALANLDAGRIALDEHAYIDAYEMLSLAWRLSEDGYDLKARRVELLTALGRAAAMTGHLDEAFERLEEAIPLATDPEARFELNYLLTLTYASQGRNNEGLQALRTAFEVAGQPLPRSLPMVMISLLIAGLSGALLYWTGLGRPARDPEAIQRRLVESRLNYAGTMLSMFDGDTVRMVHFIMRDFLNVQHLDNCAEKAIASTVYGAVLGTFQLRGVMERHTSEGVAMAESLGDRAAVAVCRAYEACGYKWAGDLDEGTRRQLAALRLLARDVPGSWYTAMMICEQAYSYAHAGRASEARRHIAQYLPDLQRTHNRMFVYNTLCVDHASRRILGDLAGAAQLWSRLEPVYGDLKQTGYVQLARVQAQFEDFVDRQDVGAEVETTLAAFASTLGEDYYSIYARMLYGYARLEALEAARASGRDGAAERARLKSSILHTSLRALAPVYRCHPYIWRAALARMDGKVDRARRLLDRAASLSATIESPRARYRIALERAKLASDDDEARMYAGLAVAVARREGWSLKARTVRERFELVSHSSSRVSSLDTHTGTRGARLAEALLTVSLASSHTLDPAEQAERALDALMRVFGAERALFYSLDESTGEASIMARAGSGVEEASQTVIQEVLATGDATVITGDEDGDALSSQSIMTQGIRSIIAAPLRMRERVLGVVYLDNRLSKGLFTEEDVGLLISMANHIAIAVETSRVARLERERSALAKDLALVGAVQSLTLPPSNTLERADVRLAAAYHPTTQCGGDWWWVEADEGGLTLWLGDVSGHGPGPAMVTSAVSGAFHAIRALQPDLQPPAILEQLDACVRRLGGDYYVSMSAVRIDTRQGTLELWNAGGPACFVLDGPDLAVVGKPGTLLGQSSAALVVGHSRLSLAPGSRVLACTDGMLEQINPKGRAIGLRGVSRMLESLRDAPVSTTVETLANHALTWSGKPEPDDDITLVMVELASTPVEPA